MQIVSHLADSKCCLSKARLIAQKSIFGHESTSTKRLVDLEHTRRAPALHIYTFQTAERRQA